MLNEQELKRLKAYKIDPEFFKIKFSKLQELGYSETQTKKLIIRPSSMKTVNAVIAKIDILTAAPYHLSFEAIVKIASHHGGCKNLEAVQASYTALNGLSFSVEQILKMVGHGGGSKNLETVQASFKTLKEFGFSADQIVKIAGIDGISKNLESVQTLYNGLADLGLDRDKMVQLPNRNGGSKRLRETATFMDELASLEISHHAITPELEQHYNLVMHAQDLPLTQTTAAISAVGATLYGQPPHEETTNLKRHRGVY